MICSSSSAKQRCSSRMRVVSSVSPAGRCTDAIDVLVAATDQIVGDFG